MSDHPQPRSAGAFSPSQVGFLALACTFAIAALYYSQPILPLIGAEFGTADTLTSQIVTIGQMGYALGLFLFVPIGDRIDRRRLILVLLLVNTAGMAACAAAPSFTTLMAATLVGRHGNGDAADHHSDRGRDGRAGTSRPRGRHRAERYVGRAIARPDGERPSRRICRMALGVRTRRSRSTCAARDRLAHPALDPRRPATLSYPRLLQSLGRLFLEHATLRAACATGFLAFAAFGALWATLATLLARPPYRLGADVAGLFGLLGIVSMVSAPILGRLTDRYGSRFVIAAGCVILLSPSRRCHRPSAGCGLWRSACARSTSAIGPFCSATRRGSIRCSRMRRAGSTPYS